MQSKILRKAEKQRVKADWVYRCRNYTTMFIDDELFSMNLDTIEKWENILINKGSFLRMPPKIAGGIIWRAFKIYLLDE